MIVGGSDWLFPATRGGGPYTGANVDERLGVGCHMLRRSFAYRKFMIGAGSKSVGQWLCCVVNHKDFDWPFGALKFKSKLGHQTQE